METTKAREIHARLIAAALLAVILAVGWPILLPWTYDTHDGHYALYNAAQLDHALRDGQLPVRWLPDLFGGRGIPLFLYYHPLASYLVVFVHLFGPGFLVAMKIVQCATIAASAWAMLAFLREHLPSPAAAVGAAAYVAAPIHVLELHVKGDPPALLAFVLAPLLLLAIGRAARGTPRGVAALALASAGLVLAHSVTTLLLLPSAALYAAVVLPRPAGAGVARIAAGCALGGAIAAFHWVPALSERDLVHIDSVLGILAFDWREHFVAMWQWLSPLWGYHGSFAGTPDDMSFQIGPAHVAGIVLGAFAWSRAKDRGARAFGVWAGLTTVFALAMTLSIARPVWEAIPPLRYIQFPWRFLMPVALAGSALTALAVARLPARAVIGACAILPPVMTGAFAFATGNRLYVAIGLFQLILGAFIWIVGARPTDTQRRGPIVLVLLFGGLALPWSGGAILARIQHEPAVIPIRERDLLPERVRLGIRRTTARDDYLPRTVGVDTIPPRDPAQEYLPPEGAMPPEEVVVRSGRVDVREFVRNGRGLRFVAETDGGGIVALNVHDFPGWTVSLVDLRTGTPSESPPGRDDVGRIVLSLPPGRFRVSLIWTETPSRRVWDLVSLLGLASTLGLLVRSRRL